MVACSQLDQCQWVNLLLHLVLVVYLLSLQYRALVDQMVPPTINLDNPEEGLGVDLVPHVARKVENMEYAMCNSFGFGGTNGSLIFKRM